MSYFDQLIHFYQVSIDKAFFLEENYDYRQAKSLRSDILQKQKQVAKLIHDYESSLQLISFNNNTDTLNTITEQLQFMKQIQTFNHSVLAIKVKSKTGYYMFVKDFIAHRNLLPF